MANVSLVVNALMASAPFCTSFALQIHQSKGWSKPRILEFVGVFVGLHPQLSGMNAVKLNGWYKH
jgi:hypothetical protein